MLKKKIFGAKETGSNRRLKNIMQCRASEFVLFI
jgi:hypothetical protein